MVDTEGSLRTLKERVLADQATSKSGQCLTCGFISTRPPEEQAEWDEMLELGSGYQISSIHRTMVDVNAQYMGKPVTRGSAENHRTSRHRRKV